MHSFTCDPVRYHGGPLSGPGLWPVEAVKIEFDDGTYRRLGNVVYWCRPWTRRVTAEVVLDVLLTIAIVELLGRFS